MKPHQLIDQNFGQHSCQIIDQNREMDVFRHQGFTFTDSGLSCDTFNILHINGVDVDFAALEDAIQYYRNKQLEFCIWINEENLTGSLRQKFDSLNVHTAEGEKGMILDLIEYSPPTSSLHANVQVVQSSDQLHSFSKAIAENWTPPDQHVISYYQKTQSQYLDPSSKIILLVYMDRSNGVSTIEMFPSDNQTIGLYGLTTLQEYRGKGIGSAMMSFALNKAKELGYKHVILQATEDGMGIYQKIGFQQITTYFEYA